QKYLYVPGVVNVNENLSSLSSAFDLKLSGETTVWGMSSSLVQVTVVPDFTFSSFGPKVKLPILIAASSAKAGVAARRSTVATPPKEFTSVLILTMSALNPAAACR